MLQLTSDHRRATPLLAAPLSGDTTLNSVLATIRDKCAVPALAAALVSSEGVIACGVFGVRRNGWPGSVENSDRFHLGSLTKSVTATMIATLVEEGRLSWQTTPLKVFPELSGYIYPSLRAVTLEQLLSHSAGITPFLKESELKRCPSFPATPREQRMAFTRWLLQLPPALPPGKRYHYSNAGYTIATAMAEKVSGRSWEDLMQERVFQPLALRNAGFGWPATEANNQPWGHEEAREQLLPHDPQPNGQLNCLVHPAGNIHMSLQDMARYLQVHLRGLQGEKTLLQRHIVQKLHCSRVRVDGTAAENLGYGLGWNVQPHRAPPGQAVSYHTGSAGTFLAGAWLVPLKDRALVVMTNSAGERAGHALHATRRAFLSHEFPMRGAHHDE
jgi:D-alanyl-D-alanine carboxypeptidase